MIARSRVVICAGPFLTSSGCVVDACSRLGVDYVDITGETPFVRQSIDRSLASILSCVFFDAFVLPSLPRRNDEIARGSGAFVLFIVFSF